MYDLDLHMRFLRSATEAWFNYTTAGWAAIEAWQNHFVNSMANQPEPAAQPLADNPFTWWMSTFAPASPPVPAKPAHQTLADNPFTWWMNAFTPASQPEPAKPVHQVLTDNPFTWWMNAFTPASQPVASPKADFGAAFFQFSPAMAAFNPNAFLGGGAKGGNPWAMTPWASASSFPWGSNPWASGWQDMMQQACCWTWPQAASFSAFQMPMTACLMAAGLPYSVAAPTARANAASMDAAQAACQGFENVMSSFRNDGGHAVSMAINAVPKTLPMFMPFWLMPHTMPGLG